MLGAKRVIGAGRNERVLSGLRDLGADATLRLDQPAKNLKEAFARAAGDAGFDVVIDYVWGLPTETLFTAIAKSEFAAVTKDTRLVQVGESAGPTISLPAAVLRSTPLTICGTAGIPSRAVLADAMQEVMAQAAQGKLRIETERIPLADIERAWQRPGQSGRRIVLIP